MKGGESEICVFGNCLCPFKRWWLGNGFEAIIVKGKSISKRIWGYQHVPKHFLYDFFLNVCFDISYISQNTFNFVYILY